MTLSIQSKKRHIFLDLIQKLKREAEGNLTASINWTASIFFSTACLLAAQTNEITPVWSSGSILRIPGTNEGVRTTHTDPAMDALKLLEQPAAIDPESSELPAFYRLAGLSHRDQSVEEKEEMHLAFEHFSKADRYVHKGDPERAVEDLLDFLDQAQFDQTRFTVLDRLGTLFVQDQNYARAATYMRKALNINPRDLSLISSYSAVLLAIGRPEETIEHLKDIDPYAVRSRSLKFSVFFYQACGHSLLNQTDRAMEHLHQAAQTDPASTLSSLVITHLDNIRSDPRFEDLQKNLKRQGFGKGS